MKTLRTMMMATLMTMVMTTATANSNPRNGERGHEALQPRTEQPGTSRRDMDKDRQQHRHDRNAHYVGKDQRCPVCNKRNCKTHNYCPTCGKAIQKRTASYGNRTNPFGGRR